MFKTFEGIHFYLGYKEVRLRTRKNECVLEYIVDGIVVQSEEYEDYKPLLKTLKKQYSIWEVAK